MIYYAWQEPESESEVQSVFLLLVTEMQDQSSPPIDVLNLSTRSYNFLKRSGLHTVVQVAALIDEELLAIRLSARIGGNAAANFG